VTARRLVAFLGPSLAAREARRLAPCTVLPPARQGDVWRALALRPRAIALIDGVFESVPSVWHHELLDALDAGVAVFGGASMGALRAAELARHGMVGVGAIFELYRRGAITGDDEVALLHGDAASGWRPLTVPLITVRATAEAARREGVLSPAEARRLVQAAAEVFYGERTWRRVLRDAAPRLRPAALERLRGLLRRGAVDPKADDARATLAAAGAFVRAGAAPPPRAQGAPRRPSSLVRRRKLLEATTVAGRAALPSAALLEALAGAPDAAALRDRGLRLALLSALARTLGLSVGEPERAAARQAFFRGGGVERRRREAYLAASGLDGADAARLVDDLALERALLDRAREAVPDGPSPEEGLATGARLAGRWAELAGRLARRRWTGSAGGSRIRRR
jgi:hypothetical protein